MLNAKRVALVRVCQQHGVRGEPLPREANPWRCLGRVQAIARRREAARARLEHTARALEKSDYE